MLDLGIQKSSGKYKDDSDYTSKYLNELQINDEITGTIYIGELKKKDIKGKEVDEFYVILDDEKNKQKWLCGLVTSAYFDDGIAKIYGEKGGRIYQLIDSLNHALNKTELNQQESYSAVFDTFRETVNKKVETVTVKAVQASNPNARTPNLCIIKATAKDDVKSDSEYKEPEKAEPKKKKESSVPIGDDPQAQQYIKEIKEELRVRYNIPNPTLNDVVEWAVKKQNEWDLSSNDITRIKAQAARQIQGK